MFGPKLLQVSFDGAQSGGNITLSGLRMSAEVEIPTGDSSSTATVTIYGMSLSQMNQLSTSGASYNNTTQAVMTMTISAQDSGGAYGVVFKGDVIPGLSYVDGADEPNIRFICGGVHGAANARKKVEPITKKGSANAEDLISQLAQKMGYRFENNGVSVKLRNPYLWGTAMSQLRQVAKAANCLWVGDKDTIAIWPPGKSRQGTYNLAPPQLVGYPSFNQAKMHVMAYFDPAFIPCQSVNVTSSLKAACGTWTTGALTYELDCLTPHGRWFMSFDCYNPQLKTGGDQG